MKIDALGGLRRYTRRFSRRFTGKYEGHYETRGSSPPYFFLDDEKPALYPLKYLPNVIPSRETPGSAAAIPFAHSERQSSVHELPSNEVPFVINPDTPQPDPQQYPTSLYPPQPTLQASVVYNLDRRASDLSSLSSLSSGFGDAKIDIPESGPSIMNLQPTRKLLGNDTFRNTIANRFSWATSRHSQSPGPQQSRSHDTVHTVNTIDTTTLEESPPRFRSVNSWVNQQTSRIERQRAIGREADSMPNIPVPKAARKSQHTRIVSGATDLAFRYHPGEEVPIPVSSRIPSEILDRSLQKHVS
jgi:hypothetical protein